MGGGGPRPYSWVRERPYLSPLPSFPPSLEASGPRSRLSRTDLNWYQQTCSWNILTKKNACHVLSMGGFENGMTIVFFVGRVVLLCRCCCAGACELLTGGSKL